MSKWKGMHWWKSTWTDAMVDVEAERLAARILCKRRMWHLERCRIRDEEVTSLELGFLICTSGTVHDLFYTVSEMRWTSSKSPAQSRCSLNRRGTSERTHSMAPFSAHRVLTLTVSEVSWTPQAALSVGKSFRSCIRSSWRTLGFDIYRTFNSPCEIGWIIWTMHVAVVRGEVSMCLAAVHFIYLSRLWPTRTSYCYWSGELICKKPAKCLDGGGRTWLWCVVCCGGRSWLWCVVSCIHTCLGKENGK